MTYITCALLAEASFLIEHYALKKTDDNYFSIYQNKTIKLIVSGIGKIQTASATTYLLQNYQADKEDKLFNIGTCTTTKESIRVGELFTIKKVIDLATSNVYHLKAQGETLTCVDKAIDSKQGIKTALADMESVGVYLSAKKFIKNEHIMILKVVSDKTDTSIPYTKDIQVLFQAHIHTIGALLDV